MDHLSLTALSFGNFVDGNEANTEETQEICKVKENILERGRLSSRLEALPRGEIIPGVLDMPGTPHKSKVATKLRVNQGKQIFPFPVVRTRALMSSWGENEGNIKEMGGKYARTMLGDTPPWQEIILGVWEMPGTPLRP